MAWVWKIQSEAKEAKLMIDRLQEEKDHYNQRFLYPKYSTGKISRLFDLVNENSTEFFYHQVYKLKSKKPSGKILDYGCGTGEKSSRLAGAGWQVFGIDISDKSIENGKKALSKNQDVQLTVMNCEETTFKENSFDIIFDFGTFSSIDIDKAINEICRILKPDGCLVCIETLGHNPISNLKRRINMITGKRTHWATNNIMTIDKWEGISKYFDRFDIRYFNFITLFFVPVFTLVPYNFVKKLLNFVWRFDQLILMLPVFKKFAFKTVVVLKEKKK